ncbi:MAG TPA: CorA family divalent cation transporter, partial [Burkholderiaceae bacterium]|nr:CorA family divalent cation transporter [Burkholderiaceae bacterium]
MINTVVKISEQLSSIDDLAQPENQAHVIWLEVNAPTAEETVALRERFGIETRLQPANVIEDGEFLYLRSQLIELGANGAPRFASVTFVLGDRVVATITDDPEFRPFGAVLPRCKRRPSNAESPKALLRLLLQTANDRATSVIDYVAEALVQTTGQISEITDGYDEKGRELGVSDLSATMRGLNDTEELILRCVEAQLTLERSVRYLGDEVDNRTEQELQVLVNELAGDVAGTKEHAKFQHERVRYLQTAVTNILNIKQNEIIKVFTIVTAVFLPPTLIGTLYGMNFAVMPELSWQHGFIYAMCLTVGAALLPLWYIKRRGW